MLSNSATQLPPLNSISSAGMGCGFAAAAHDLKSMQEPVVCSSSEVPAATKFVWEARPKLSVPKRKILD